MNTPNPLVPQGTTPSGGKSTFRNAVLTIVAIHVAFIGSLLFWGCSKDKDTAAVKEDSDNISSLTTETTPADTNVGATASVPTGSVTPPAMGSNAVVPPVASVASNVSVPPPIPAAPTSVAATSLTPPTVTGSAQEYTVAKGDNPATIAKNHGVSVKALMAANPGLDPKKLQPGKKIQIPAPTTVATAAGATSGSLTGEAPTGAVDVYTVKQGDSLTHIATSHHTSVKAIVALNGLKSQNSIRPGQKLKMPAPKAATSAPADSGAATTTAASAVTPLTPAPRAN